MKNYTILLTILGILGTASGVHADESNLKKTAVSNIVGGCEGIIVDQKKFDLAMASGFTQAESQSHAAIGSRFSQQQYDMALSSGMSVEDATAFATSYRYSNNSKFCVQLRGLIKSEMLKGVGQ